MRERCVEFFASTHQILWQLSRQAGGRALRIVGISSPACELSGWMLYV